ncbi:MAG: endonuclease/exonuclease/phosphatase family protein [Cyanobacteria bacterium J06598_1]
MKQPMLRVANWNVARPQSQPHRERLAEVIQAISADIWILTETHESLSPGPTFTCATTTVSDRVCKPGEAWVSIWTHFPTEQVFPTSDSARTLAVRILPEQTKPIIVYGTVLPWLGSPWRNIPSADGAAFAAALESQLSDWISLQHEHPDCDFILAGDFNQDLAQSHYYGSRKNRAALNLALKSAKLHCLTAGELDPVLEHAPTHASIDHICVSSDLKSAAPPISWPALSKPQKNLSDHFGLLVSLNLTGINQ